MSNAQPTPYRGNWPAVVNRDAKYSIRRSGGAMPFLVTVEYRTDEGERWYASTESHAELVSIVNEAKIAVNGEPGGAFYINEFQQILVPAGRPVAYFLAGRYSSPLIFDFEGTQLSGRPYDLDGSPLEVGDDWKGVHPGIPYKLKAGGKDIAYDEEVRTNVTREVRLSAHAGAGPAQQLAARLRAVMGFEGGRFYVNEFRCLFTGHPYRYLGKLEAQDPWFPEPHAVS